LVPDSPGEPGLVLKVTGYFGPRTLQAQDTSDLKSGSEVSGHFDPGTEVSRDTSDLGPKCLGSEVSGKRFMALRAFAANDGDLPYDLADLEMRLDVLTSWHRHSATDRLLKLGRNVELNMTQTDVISAISVRNR